MSDFRSPYSSYYTDRDYSSMRSSNSHIPPVVYFSKDSYLYTIFPNGLNLQSQGNLEKDLEYSIKHYLKNNTQKEYVSVMGTPNYCEKCGKNTGAGPESLKTTNKNLKLLI